MLAVSIKNLSHKINNKPILNDVNFELKNKLLKPLKGVKKTMDDLNNPRQDFSKTYSANGYIDLYRKAFILKNKKLFGNRVMGYITPLTMEIDSIEELKYMNSNYND